MDPMGIISILYLHGIDWDLHGVSLLSDAILSMFIVTDIHLEHLENTNQTFTWEMCSKYPLRIPAKNMHLEQVFKDVFRTFWSNLCVLSVCPQLELCKDWYSLQQGSMDI